MADMTLTEALRRKIQEEGKTIDDVDFIMVGTLGLYADDFWKSADRCGWDINKLKDEFRIVFKDRSWIGKHYSREPGQVRLKYHKSFDKPVCILLHPMPQDYYDVDI